MKRFNRTTYIILLATALISAVVLVSDVGAVFNCSTGAKEPPFLAPGVPPNLLLLLDNSASMLDMAYIAEGGECYDGTADDGSGTMVDSYATGTTYAGLFDNAAWYQYSAANSRFEPMGTAPSTCTGTGAYLNDPDGDSAPNDVCVVMTGSPETGDVSVNFKARGNFLNWATASKFDIEKKVLTGGKWEGVVGNGKLIMEHRGCMESRFIKQVMLQDQSGVTNYMNLGVHSNKGGDFAGAGADTTVIDIFQINETGFDYQDCQDAIDEMADPNTSLGTLKGDIDACMEYAPNQSYTEPQNPAFNQAVQTCWWWEEHVGVDELTAEEAEAVIWDHSHATSLMNHCESMYETMPPTTVDTSDPSYVCNGLYDTAYGTSFDKDNQPAYTESAGYAGRCWVPEEVIIGTEESFVDCEYDETAGTYSLPEGYLADSGYLCMVPTGSSDTTQVVHQCSGNYNANQGTCNKPWVPITESASEPLVIPGHWVDNGNDCVIQALIDFCGSLNIVELVDPYDATQATGTVWNLPAMITDVGISGQLGDPMFKMLGHIQENADPTGLLDTYANRIRFGAMAFNDNGSAYECDYADPYVTYYCELENLKDGASVISPIGDSVTSLADSINATPANSWTPLAEAFLNAVGYYTQNTSTMQIQGDDFPNTPPCTNWCQSNNILIITEGASTADLHEKIRAFADADATDDPAGCGVLNGSSYLDDLAGFAKTGTLTFSYDDPADPDKEFQNITTFIVRTGTPRDVGTGECAPDTLLSNAAANGGLGEDATQRLANSYLDASNPADLYSRLDQVFSDLAARAASGSAASVISSSSSGEGAVYQAIFWPKKEANDALSTAAAYWTGEVHALFLDSYGHMREDDGDFSLESNGDCSAGDTDPCVDLYFDSSEGQNKSRACYDGTLQQNADGTFTCSGTIKELEEVNYIWSVAEWLGRITDANILTNRTTYLSDTPQRYIFTWNDLDRDGIVDKPNEVMNFTAGSSWATLGVTGGHGSVAMDFGIPTHIDASTARTAADVNADVDAIINWIRGREDATLRNRTVPTPASFTDVAGDTMPWRLGDVVNSTPTLVSRPSDGYHLLYKDSSYRDFYNTYSHRRQMVYFGGNDGMLHAVNAGFYDPDSKTFKRSYNTASGTYGNTGPYLGAEMWAYVPYNLLPHLKCLTDPDYLHKYYVDMKPKIFDVRIWADSPSDTVHEGGWGTILVVGMRFGGAEVAAAELDALDGNNNFTDDRVFKSAYIVLDITNPEAPPALLGELTFNTGFLDFGYTTGAPTVIPMKNDNDDYDWYLVLGSGPTDVSAAAPGTAPKVGVFPLKELIGGSPAAFKIPSTANAVPSQTAAGNYILTGNGFVSDMVTVDYDLVTNYKADVVYFGTIEGGYCQDSDTAADPPCDTQQWGGKLYRLVTDEASPDASGNNTAWEIKLMIDVGRPIMAAPTVGYDDRGNYWVYFGTGRFFDLLDKSDDSSNGVGDKDRFFGLKEYTDPAAVTATNRNGFTWPVISNTTSTTAKDAAYGPGSRDILQTDQILVTEALYPTSAAVSCASGDCLPADVDTFNELVNHIVGDTTTTTVDSVTTTTYSGTDGWVLEFQDQRERNLGQSTLLGGLITFTSYQPFQDLCESEGYTYLYGLYYQTGTGWFQDVFYNNADSGGVSGSDPPATVTTRMSLGKGMSTTPNLHVGAQEGSTAFVQTSTGAIIKIEQPNLPIKNTKTGRMSWRSE